MSESTEKVQTEFSQFVESVKAKIPIDQLYTKLTGEQFSRVESRPRAKISWREDNSPSLCYVPDKNLLTDFTDRVEGSDKAGKSYNVIDILQKCGGAINFAHALQMACELIDEEIPDKFKKKSNKELGHLPYNIGPKLKEVWQACQDHTSYLIDNPSKRPAQIVKFFEERNIPFEADFIKTMNFGIAPNYDVVFNILKEQGILHKGKDDKELNIFRVELNDNNVVYPLYNVDGGLCGLRFRQLDNKDFAEWRPAGNTCFFNGQRFKFRPQSNRKIMIVESEMGLIAYGIAVYEHLKKLKIGDPNIDIAKKLDESLRIIFSTGSKGGSVTIFKDQLSKVLYLQDHDISDMEEDIAPKNHPILKTCARISKEINADDLVVADWEKLSYIKPKFDFEDYIKHNDYKLESIELIETISVPRLAINAIKKYCSFIKNEDNRREVQIKYVMSVSDSLQYSQREVFKELVKKEFAISEDVQSNISSQHREAKIGPYSIDPLGRIVETSVDDNGNKMTHIATNFYMRINDEISYFSHSSNTMEKFYNVEVVINGKVAGSGEIESTDIVDNKIMQGFLATKASLTDLVYFDNDLRGKSFPIITSLMSSIPVMNKRYVFSSLGRPFENFCMSFFKTEYFCLFPKVSVINGVIKYNENFEVNLSGKDAIIETSHFEFNISPEHDYRNALDLFWNTLRHVHDCNVIDSLVGIVVDSCARELQGIGIIENDHGFPIYLVGQSGTYKTTAAIMAISLLGKFKTGNDCLSWNGTSLSLEHQLLKIGNMAHCIDDLKVEDMASVEFARFIHNIYGGNTRTRMDSTATKIKGGNKLTCSVIITSESENENIPEAIAARMITLRIPICSKAVAAERDVFYRKMINPYEDNNEFLNIDLMRSITPRLISWMHKRGSIPYSTSIKKWKTVFVKILDEFNAKKANTERPTDMVSRIVAGFEQMTEFLKNEGVANSLELDANFESFVEYWKKQIKKQMVRIDKQSSTHRVVDLLCQMIYSESIGIKVYKDNRWIESKRNYGNFPIRDITYPDGIGRKLLIMSPNSVIKQMNAQVDNSIPIIVGKFTEDLKESGLFEMKDGKPMQYPVPDDQGKINFKNPSTAIVIDYNKLMDIYQRIKND